MLESVFNKIAGVQAYNFIERRLQHRCFLLEIPKILGTPILKNIWKKEQLPKAASCLSETKYGYAVHCYTRWNQFYILTMVLPKRYCFVLCLTAQKMKFSNKDFFSKCDQICRFLRIWSHVLKKSLIENIRLKIFFLLFLSASYLFSNSLIRNCFFENFNYDTQLFQKYF